MSYTVNDKRGESKSTCRVCGSSEEHSSEYNKPTMACIEHLRGISHQAKLYADSIMPGKIDMNEMSDEEMETMIDSKRINIVAFIKPIIIDVPEFFLETDLKSQFEYMSDAIDSLEITKDHLEGYGLLNAKGQEILERNEQDIRQIMIPEPTPVINEVPED